MTNSEFLEVIENRTFSSIRITQSGFQYFLIVEFEGKSNVFIGKNGKRKTYRHRWQITDWLEERFGIRLDE